jgi:hypothetical protein
LGYYSWKYANFSELLLSFFSILFEFYNGILVFFIEEFLNSFVSQRGMYLKLFLFNDLIIDGSAYIRF